MRKIKFNSLDNRCHCIPGDYVVEAKFNLKQCNMLTDLLTEVMENRVIDGFEFTIQKPSNKIEAITVYGRKASSYVQELNKIVMNELGLNTRMYCVVE